MLRSAKWQIACGGSFAQGHGIEIAVTVFCDFGDGKRMFCRARFRSMCEREGIGMECLSPAPIADDTHWPLCSHSPRSLYNMTVKREPDPKRAVKARAEGGEDE